MAAPAAVMSMDPALSGGPSDMAWARTAGAGRGGGGNRGCAQAAACGREPALFLRTGLQLHQ